MARHPMKKKIEEKKPERREWCMSRSGMVSFGVPAAGELILNQTEAEAFKRVRTK